MRTIRRSLACQHNWSLYLALSNDLCPLRLELTCRPPPSNEPIVPLVFRAINTLAGHWACHKIRPPCPSSRIKASRWPPALLLCLQSLRSLTGPVLTWMQTGVLDNPGSPTWCVSTVTWLIGPKQNSPALLAPGGNVILQSLRLNHIYGNPKRLPVSYVQIECAGFTHEVNHSVSMSAHPQWLGCMPQTTQV